MNKEEFRALVGRITDGDASDAEIAIYNKYYREYQRAGEAWNVAEMGDEVVLKDRLKKRIDEKIKPVVVVPFWRRTIGLASAAIVVLSLFTALFFHFNGRLTSVSEDLVKQDVAPGGNKAVLTLADGRIINLSDAANGNVAEQAGMAITKAADGKLVYTVKDQNENQVLNYNTIATPVGGQYQVNLPDGTKVWLNAASSLKFPSSFAKLKDREVQLSGEAYFEVAHNAKVPFIVKTNRQEVLVLGTHFNINSYADESTTKTTLLQGAVLARMANFKGNDGDHVLLKPGQQAILGQNFQVKPVDVEEVTAWKDGNFLFNDTDLRDIMKQLSRWYNVRVDYDEIPQNRIFTGFISRSVNLSQVLQMLEVTGKIQFKIENKTIKITDLKKEPM
jgi:transmembrane sensor